MKVCSGCNQSKDKKEFNKDRTEKDGLHHYCKECASFYSKLYYENNKEYVKNKNKIYGQNNKEKISKREKENRKNNKTHRKEIGTWSEKLCPCCGQMKLAEEFSHNSTEKSGLGTYCKDCKNKKCRNRKCVEDITVEEVFEAVVKMHRSVHN